MTQANRPQHSATPSLQPSSSARRSIAIIGASADRSKFGNKAVRAYLQQGYDVYPVNPKEETIEGLKVCMSILDVPVRPNLISLYVPPAVGLKLLGDIVKKGCDELWFNPGAESEELMEQARRLGLNPINACSIVGVGVRPETL
jgi:predicted CoA-binding protein